MYICVCVLGIIAVQVINMQFDKKIKIDFTKQKISSNASNLDIQSD